MTQSSGYNERLFSGSGLRSYFHLARFNWARKVVASFGGSAEEAVVKGKKLYPMHLRRRKSSKTRVGHRQKYLEVTIDKIEA